MRDEICLSMMGLAAALAMGGCSASPTASPSAAPSSTAEASATAEAPAAPAKPEEIPKVPVETGQACATAVAECGGGVCQVTLDNTCAAPMTCNLNVLTVCQAEQDMIQVKARSKDTFAAQTKGKMSLSANCNTGRTVATKVQALECK